MAFIRNKFFPGASQDFAKAFGMMLGGSMTTFFILHRLLLKIDMFCKNIFYAIFSCFLDPGSAAVLL